MVILTPWIVASNVAVMRAFLARHLPPLVAAVSLLASPRAVLAQEPAADPAVIRGPIVHVVVKNASPEKGPVKLARYRGLRSTTVAAGNQVVVQTYFDELCTEPCGVAVDVSERPMFFFVRDGTPVSNTFRINNLTGDITLKVRTTRRGLMMAGSVTLLFLVGIPMVIAAAPRVWMAQGRPGPDLNFKRLWRARL